MSNIYDITGIRNGARIEVVHPEMPCPVPATYIGFCGGLDALVRLDTTERLINVPRKYIRRTHA